MFGDVGQRGPRVCKLILVGDSVALRRPVTKNEDTWKVPDGGPRAC